MAENRPLHPKLANPKPNFLEHFMELANKASVMLSMPNAEEPITNNAGPGFFNSIKPEHPIDNSVSYEDNSNKP